MTASQKNVQTEKQKVLIVDDDPALLSLFTAVLESSGFIVKTISKLADLIPRLEAETFDAILLDIFLNNDFGLDSIPDLLRIAPHTPIMVLTGHNSIELAVDAISRGASGFLLKTQNPLEIADEVRLKIIEQKPRFLNPVDPEQNEVIGQSEAIREVLDQASRMRDVDSTVLIFGESGTGKELIARALHKTSKRNSQPFLAINCGAIPETLLESELFGHKKGAFTDAKTDRKGVFEHCSEGTLFLDEIGELPTHLQVKLLRVLQEKEVTPIGSNSPLQVNTRVIVATNRNLQQLVNSKQFREDLYYRLSVLTIDLPPLRERREDIRALTEHFIAIYSERYGKDIQVPTCQIFERLKAYDWPGNVRELQNAVERAVVLSVNGKLSLENLLPRTDMGIHPDENEERMDGFVNGMPQPFNEAKQNFERNYLVKLLKMTRGNIAEAARLSGQYRANLYRLMDRYKIMHNEYKG